jgi:hypothetical protein
MVRGKATEFLRAIGVASAVVALGLARYWIDPRFFFFDDMQTGAIGQALEIGRALAHGEWPLLSNSSWVATAFAGEMQYGIFSPFVLAYDLLVYHLDLSLAASTTMLALLHLAITAAGAYLLARDHELPPALAVVVAFSASMNGWLLMWAAKTWFTLLTSFAWLPWYWLGMRRLARAPFSPRAFLGTVIALYLLITVGWPGTDLMALVIATGFLLSALMARDARRFARLFAANLVATLLTAPMLLVAIEYLGTTARTQMNLFNWGWRVPWSALFAMVLPTFRSDWYRWSGPGPHTAIELAGALVPLIGLVAALVVLRGSFVRRHRFEVSLLAASVLFCISPSLWMFQWSFRWLPFFHLVLAITGALGLRDLATASDAVERWSVQVVTSSKRIALGPRSPSLWLVILLGISSTASFIFDQNFGLSMMLAFLTAFLAAAWIYADLRGSDGFRRAFPAIASVYSIVFALSLVPTHDEFPEFQIGEVARYAAPYKRELTYIGIYPWVDMRNDRRMNDPELRGDPIYRPGNLAMASGLDFVNGYSPLVPRGLFNLLGVRAIWGHTDEREAYRILFVETKPGAVLEHMSVEGLTFSRRLARQIGPQALAGWHVTAAWGPDLVFERSGPKLPDVYFAGATRMFDSPETLGEWARSREAPAMPVLLVGRNAPTGCAAAKVESHQRSRHRSVAAVDASRCASESLLVFARPWVVGFRASLNGRVVPVEAADLLMPAVRVPPGFKGRVEVWYWPRSLTAGFVIAGITIVLTAVCMIVWAIRTRAARRKPGPERAG